MSIKRIGVIGAGGHAKVVVQLMRELCLEVAAIFDDDPALQGTLIQGIPVVGSTELIPEHGITHGVIAVGNNARRKALASRLNLNWLTLVHPKAHIDPTVRIGAGSVVFVEAVVQVDAVVGQHVIINNAATVAHDCRVDDFVHIAPGCNLAGNVTLEEGVFMGIGSAVIPKVTVGPWSVVGAGGVIVRDLEGGVMAVGVPAEVKHKSAASNSQATSATKLPDAVHGTNGKSPRTKRVYLSPPHMSGVERTLLLDAFDSNWVAPLGPHVDAFEKEFAALVGRKHAVALASGTGALHLGLLLLGVQPGDDVLTSTLTFAATANAIRYVGANPVFIDSEPGSWNLDPQLLADELEEAMRCGKRPKAVVAVDVFGQCADYEAILKTCQFYEIPLIEDAAEALGATYQGRPAGSFGDMACFSFNGNKIITTSGGGMLVTDRGDWAEKARFLATQARDPAPHYEHSEVGYNYRMSNLLAAVGRGQLQCLADRVQQRRLNFDRYVEQLGDLPGISFMPEIAGGCSTRWLTCIVVDPTRFGATREDIRLELEKENIESRPIWKPMHLQPVYFEFRKRNGQFAAKLFEDGLCLPSGSNMSPEDQERVIKIIRKMAPKAQPPVSEPMPTVHRTKTGTLTGA